MSDTQAPALQAPALQAPVIQTIGYEGTTIDSVIRTLSNAHTRLLIDVRAVPQSRKPGFSKRQLAAALDEAGIAYIHLQALGTPKPGRDAVRAGHPEKMIALYKQHITGDRPQAELHQAVQLAKERTACLLCFERDHRMCHRRLIAEMISAETGQPVTHLAV
ncbi:DUF488 family protein [Rhodopila sp.]|uniref:DUF488 domain-containing protein n=1 Tax=Rhodopila sp. TaxID=2480087 RepID=UPI002D157930|nr:DUF488 domain-containing protein [Rhodopila sp.]HVZ08557.1 DUF488 domain-containing protein [Rhodopila sp.]